MLFIIYIRHKFLYVQLQVIVFGTQKCGLRTSKGPLYDQKLQEDRIMELGLAA
jgi:hypothetical protein